MNVYLNYIFNTEMEEEINCAKEYFKEREFEVVVDGNTLFASGSQNEFNSDESIKAIFLAKAKCEYMCFLDYMKHNVTLEGTIDTSETAGECMDFCFTIKDGQMKSLCSPWYIENCMSDIDDYESFCDIIGDFSKEEYDSVKECEFVYILETEEGDKISDNIPLYDCEL